MIRVGCALSLLLIASAAQAAPDVTGNWIVQDRTGVVTIERCGASICGRITRGLNVGPDYPKTDVHNPDPALRGRKMIGLPVISGFTAKGDRWVNGKIYDPEHGRTYKASLRLNPDGSLRVTGCFSFICDSRRWTRK
jgi:uncharacterized protein (DUF2147 family)